MRLAEINRLPGVESQALNIRHACILFFALTASASFHDLPTQPGAYRFPNGRVLAAQPGSDVLSLRVAVEDGLQRSIKYLFLNPELAQKRRIIADVPPSIQLPHLPSGDWNEARVFPDRHGVPEVGNATRTSHQAVVNDWHPRRFDYFAFINVETLQQDRLQIVRHPEFNEPILLKIASFPWDIPSVEQEARIYQRLRGSGAVPYFLGHVTESGRIIGFITEYIREIPSVRRAHIQNCLIALQELHRRGIVHGDAHSDNCLIRPDSSAALIDFELAEHTWSDDEFGRDLDIMDRCILSVKAELRRASAL